MTTKTRVTEEEYDEMLGVIYPVYWEGGLFLVGEPYDHKHGIARYAAYDNPSKGVYFSLGLMTRREARNYKQIEEQL